MNTIDKIFEAIESIELQSLELLLRDISNIGSIRDESGNSLLVKAAGRGSTSMVEFLLKKGVGVNDINNTGESALHIACRHNYPEIVLLLLMQEGIAIDMEDSFGNRAIRIAANGNNHSIVNLILKHKMKGSLSMSSRKYRNRDAQL